MTAMIMVFFENASPWLFVIRFIPLLTTGSSVTLMIVTSAYLTDISTPDTIVIR